MIARFCTNPVGSCDEARDTIETGSGYFGGEQGSVTTGQARGDEEVVEVAA